MAFDEVYKEHYNELRRFGRQLNISPDKCEDLNQETFLRFYVELKKEVVFENPRAWLYKVYLNLFKTQYNSRKYEPENPGIQIRIDEPATDLNEEYSKNEKQRIVLEMLDQLKDREKEILLLYHNGFSYAEMAEIMGINPNSVGKTLVRAIDRLKETLKVKYYEMFE